MSPVFELFQRGVLGHRLSFEPRALGRRCSSNCVGASGELEGGKDFDRNASVIHRGPTCSICTLYSGVTLLSSLNISINDVCDSRDAIIWR